MTETPTTSLPETDLPEQLRIRRDKRDRLLDAGIPAYPVSVPRTHSLAEVRERWGHLEQGEETSDVVCVAGRVVFVRNTGKLAFATLQEGVGTRLQVMLSMAEVGEEALAAWKAVVDLGDHVFVEGRVISSRRGELSVLASRWGMASKALRPLPVLHRELSEEARVRQRYADLVVRQEARDMVRTKATALRAIRAVLDAQGYVEVETPVIQLVHGGAAARPFRTHMNAFDHEMVLRIALELNLKKAVVGGVDRVYEMGRIFRNEGVDATHSPEFTMLEAYQAWGDQRSIGALIRDLYLGVGDALGSRVVDTAMGTVDLGGEWRWLPVYDAVSEVVDEPVTLETSKETLLRHADGMASTSTRASRRTGSSSSSSASSSSPPCSSRRSCATTRRSPSRWPGPTATPRASSRRGTSSSPGSSAAPASPSSWTRSCSVRCSRRSRCAPPVATRRPCSSTRTSCAPWSTALHRWEGSASGSTASSCSSPARASERRYFSPTSSRRPEMSSVWPYLAAIIPTILVATLFYFLVKSMIEGDRRERIAQAAFEREQDARRRVAENDTRPGPSATPSSDETPGNSTSLP